MVVLYIMGVNSSHFFFLDYYNWKVDDELMSSQKGFAHILLLLIIIVVAIGALVFWQFFKPTFDPQNITTNSDSLVNETEWRTYTSSNMGFSIQYPSDWSYRELETGVSFYETIGGENIGEEPISVQVLNKSANGANLPFKDYVKTAAMNEIQNYVSLSSINPIKTSTGVSGYSTTWNVRSIGGNTELSESLPISYFEIPGDNTATIQVTLDNDKYIDIYERMISTLEYFDDQETKDVVDVSGVRTYSNELYGFQITYPDSYEALTSKDDLSGWPNAVVIIYNGGQAYDVVVEAWDSVDQYQEKYGEGDDFNLTVKEHGGKIITILNSTEEPQNEEVISTFKFI